MDFEENMRIHPAEWPEFNKSVAWHNSWLASPGPGIYTVAIIGMDDAIYIRHGYRCDGEYWYERSGKPCRNVLAWYEEVT